MNIGPGRRPLAAPFTLLAGFGALFAIGTVAAGLHGRLPATGVLIAAVMVVGVLSFAGEPVAAIPLGFIGWLTAVGFSRPPYADLRPTGPLAAHAAVALGVTALAGAGAGLLYRSAQRYILVIMGTVSQDGQPGSGPDPAGPRPPRDQQARSGLAPSAAAPPAQTPAALALSALAPAGPAAGAGDALAGRRRWLGILLAVAGLPLVTLALVALGHQLSLTDDLLIYLVAVVVLAVIGGFWPAVLAAVAASMLLNWYFTPPVHTFTIDRPENLLALLLFVTVAVAVSSVVHLAARRAVQAARSRQEAVSLLALAQTVLGGADTPGAVLAHLTRTLGGRAELQEQVAGHWARIAVSGTATGGAAATRADGRRTRPGAAAYPGGPGRGAGRRQPDAHRPARRGQPRPAHAAGVHQGQRQQPASDRCRVDRRRPGRPAGHDRAERRPARRADRQPARHEPPAHWLAAAVPALNHRGRGGAGRAARPRRGR
jgi:two-component system sensor histidine kinase KdpD